MFWTYVVLARNWGVLYNSIKTILVVIFFDNNEKLHLKNLINIHLLSYSIFKVHSHILHHSHLDFLQHLQLAS